MFKEMLNEIHRIVCNDMFDLDEVQGIVVKIYLNGIQGIVCTNEVRM